MDLRTALVSNAMDEEHSVDAVAVAALETFFAEKEDDDEEKAAAAAEKENERAADSEAK